MKAPHITIIGSGFSGSLVAHHLVEKSTGPLRITMIDRGGKFGRGIAYSTMDHAHLLNVPARNMSALPKPSDHFESWLKTRGHFRNETIFYPRSLYGEYIRSILAYSVAAASSKGIEVQLLSEEVVGVEKLNQDRFSVSTGNGQKWETDVVVFALGLFPPGGFTKAYPCLMDNPRYISMFWTNPIFPLIPSKATIGIIGTGLSMIDAVLSLESRGHTGKIFAFSRNGFLPKVHEILNPSYRLDVPITAQSNPLNLFRFIKAELKRIDHINVKWTDVIDSLRPITNQIWIQWNTSQKKQFLRRLRPYWNTHRHRMAPEVGKKINSMQQAELFEVIAARIRSIESNTKSISIQFQHKGKEELSSKSVDYLIDCSGPESDFRNLSEPLIFSILNNTDFQVDPTGMGLTAVNPKTRDKAKRAFMIGPLNKGELFETTAVPELRVQAEDLADNILDQLK